MQQARSDGAASRPRTNNPALVWLQADGVRFTETAPFFEALMAELLRAGIDVWRATTGVPILHPQVDSLSCLWQRDQPLVERRFKQDAEGLKMYRNSPMVTVYAGGQVRANLERPAAPGEFPILTDLRGEGVTDYVAWPLPFSDGSWKAITFATRRPGGFPANQIEFLKELVPTFSRLLEIQTLRRTALILLDTYVGPSAGQRVMDGVIKRGMCETLRAVIWMCDLRGFTELSERVAGPELVAFLNDYFGAMSEAVGRHGGEVLKFIGDAMLAIFPLDGAAGTSAAARALTAASEAQRTIAAVNVERRQAGHPEIRFGLALHVGDVLYGNIGGPDRLDFTVIGQAVNVVSRIESLCKITGRSVLLSGEFAELYGSAVEPVGKFALKGVGSEQPLFAPLIERPD
jgi:adenylate cyclase